MLQLANTLGIPGHVHLCWGAIGMKIKVPSAENPRLLKDSLCLSLDCTEGQIMALIALPAAWFSSSFDFISSRSLVDLVDMKIDVMIVSYTVNQTDCLIGLFLKT